MIAIVTVGYNRPDSVKRLLESLAKADYCGEQVTLYISIDKGERQKEVIDVANDFMWEYGEKIIRAYETKQGLMSHIIQCGDLTNVYDAVIILEDDLTVSPAFYSYFRQTLNFYRNDERIAGISLYSYQVNEFNSRPFEPVRNNCDVFMMQVAQSWGQCWSKEMWLKFKEWPYWNSNVLPARDDLPYNVSRWKSSSWKKNYMTYIVDTNKYFVYPYVSLSTNHSDEGTHSSAAVNDYQVSLLEKNMEWRLMPFEDCVKYDVFFERIGIENSIPFVLGKKVCLDLYGCKRNFGDADILISTKSYPYKVIKTIQLKYRPHEINCINPVYGNGIFIYDLHIKDNAPRIDKYICSRYDIRALKWKSTLLHGYRGLVSAIKNRIHKW